MSIVTFKELREKIHTYLNLHEGHDYIIDIVLASRLSLCLEKPLWIMLQANSSSGKSKMLGLLNGDEHCHQFHSLTSKTLFSGHANAQGGYIPRIVGKAGLLVFPDFTTVLSARSTERNEIFNQLRIAYDGEASRKTGIDIGDTPTWHGKVGCICGVTNSIEKVKAKISDLGERFLYYRHKVPPFNINKYGNGMDSSRMKLYDELEDRTLELINSIDSSSHGSEPISDDNLRKIAERAILIAHSRAVVERDGKSRDITYHHQPEEPYRLIEQISTLYNSLSILHGEDSERTMEVINVVTTSSIPELRLIVIKNLSVSQQKAISIQDLINIIRLPRTTVAYLLEEMEIIEIISKEIISAARVYYKLTEKFNEKWDKVFH